MTWPKEALVLHGGCNCRAIRYKVEVPPLEERPITPYRTPDADVGQDARIPAVYMDHCNDCRRATSAIIPIGLVTETRYVSISCLPKEAVTQTPTGKIRVADDKRQWRNIGLVARDEADAVVEGTTLGHYIPSPNRNRWFCTHCGTPIGYSIFDGAIPKEWGWPKMFDIWLGTLDRADLEKDYMRPERQLWCARGVPWIREMGKNGARAANGEAVPHHPLTKIDKVVGDDITKDLEELGLDDEY